MSAVVDVEVRSGVAIWSMNAAPVNAIETSMVDALTAALDAAENDPQISVIVLSSRLAVFSAGADAGWMARIIDSEGTQALLDQFTVMMDEFRVFCSRLSQSRLVSIAAIDGHALAGGLELAAACDLRFVAERPRLSLGVPEMKLFGAMPSGGGGVPFLARLLGASRALLFILEGEPVGPTQAVQMGLADRLIENQSASEAAIATALLVAERAGPVGINAAKSSVMRGRELSLDQALAFDRALHWDAMRRGKFLDGVERFARRYA